MTPRQADFVPRAPGGPAFGPVDAEVTLAPREEAKVRLVARSGGWLRVALKASAGPEIEGGGRVVADVGNPAPVPSGMWSHADEPGNWGGGLATTGPQWFSQPLAPGRYVLRVELPKSPATMHPFVIHAGAVTDLEVSVAR